MALFTSKKSLRQRSGEAIGIITNAIKELTSVNEEAKAEKIINENLISDLTAKNSDLDMLMAENSQIQKNLEAIVKPVETVKPKVEEESKDDKSA